MSTCLIPSSRSIAPLVGKSNSLHETSCSRLLCNHFCIALDMHLKQWTIQHPSDVISFFTDSKVQRHGNGSLNLKLADFGLAMVVTEPVFTVCGTPTYVAPEILAETGKVWTQISWAKSQTRSTLIKIHDWCQIFPMISYACMSIYE